MAPVDVSGNIQRKLTIVNAWMETLLDVIEASEADKAHLDRIGALEDSVERVISAAQEVPQSLRLGPLQGLRNLFVTLAGDMVDPEEQIEHGSLPDDDEFLERELLVGTVPALLERIAGAIDEVGETLVGAAREISARTDVPDEVVSIDHVTAVTWAKHAIGVITGLERTLRNSQQRSILANQAVARDSWVAILAIACALAQIADHDALDARIFLGCVSDAFHAADRASKSLEVRRNLSPWKESDPFADDLGQPLQELRDLADEATNIVIDGLVGREANLGRIAWREITGGRLNLAEDDIRGLVREGLDDKAPALLRLDVPHDRMAEDLVAIARQVREEWARKG